MLHQMIHHPIACQLYLVVYLKESGRRPSPTFFFIIFWPREKGKGNLHEKSRMRIVGVVAHGVP